MSGKDSSLGRELRAHLLFILWVVTLGPAAFVAALTKALGPHASWSVLLGHYGVAVLHFVGYSLLCTFSLLVYRVYERWHPPGRVAGIAGPALAIALPMAMFLGGGLLFHSDTMHFFHDGMVATVVLVVERLHHRFVASRREAEHRELENERERRAALEARWCSLESRVRPHFLFNTLSSIRELMHRDADEADAMTQRFADLLRFSLDSERQAVVPLEEEMRMVTGYLEIERMRLGARLRWEAVIAPECRACPVPSLSVLTLVENSVKHAMAPRRAGGRVTIAARIVDDAVQIEVADDGPGFDPSAIMQGHGLDLLLRRLENSAEAGGRLDISSGEHGTVVTLSIPVHAAVRQVPA